MLAGAASTVLLVGCSPGSGSDGSGDGPSAADRARARVARDSEALAGRYAAVIAAHPALAELLEPLRAEVVRHAEAFGGGASATPSASESESAAGSGSASPSPVPADEKAALAELVTAEKELSDRRGKALLEVPGELARLMASVAAAGAGHAFLLTEGAK
ncbi:hypothetical protein FNH04_31215 [Streptomyces phyllanthi]|uniref:Lipoprotein n=1 Tax=Streptomyces phyllanthi TaxID=1803180 RepID=A0A5N8WCV6_9ACTN|nr:hypothetical protein [Streptomyces phyllanthi]